MVSCVQTFSRLDTAYKLATANEKCFLTIDAKNTLTLTNVPENEATCDALMKKLIADLNELTLTSKLDNNLPKDTLKTLKERTVTYFTKKMVPEDNPTYQALQEFHFPLAQGRWKYARSQQNYEKILPFQDIDHESKTGQTLIEQYFLKNMPKYTTDSDLDILMFPRDVLFMRKLILRYITEYTLLQQEINDLILSKFANRVPVTAVEDSEAVIFGHDQTNDREQSLQKIVRDAAKRIVTHATNKLEFSASKVQPALKSLHQYQKLADHDPVFFKECLEILELNERICRLKKLDYKWRAVDFSVRGFTNPDFVPFRTLSYLLKRHLFFIFTLASTYRERVEVINTCPLEERVQQHCLLAQFYRKLLKTDLEFTNVFATKSTPHPDLYKILAKTSATDDVNLYTLFANAIEAHARITKNDRLSNLTYSQEIPVVAGEDDIDQDEEYTWTKTTSAQYAHADGKLKKLERGISLVIPQLFKDAGIESPIKRGSPTGFIDDLPLPRPPRPQRISKKEQKRKKVPSPASSPETSTTPEEVNAVDTLCAEIAKVTLQPRTKSPETKKVRTVRTAVARTPSPPLVPREPQRQEVSAHLKYDSRVTRWNHDKYILTTDPDYIKSEYSSKLSKVIYREHNFTKYTDFYVNLGTPDPKMYGRIQLYGEMIMVINGKVERRLGTYTYTKDADGLYFHKYFKAKGSETTVDKPIDAEKAAKIWEILIRTPLEKEIPTNPQQITRDRGYLIGEHEGIITIMDPTTELFIDSSKPFAVDLANYTLIRLVRM
ncbi:MAG: hypothetical protein LLF94_06205 [Chlamydiales bacterium]|nr:hypothetical protein [Chlamydiales bacterium]